MNWKYKAIIEHIFSIIPFGQNLNYFFQKYVSKSLPVNDEQAAVIIERGLSHLNALKRYYRRPISEARFYEFGAGVDLIIPLTFYSFGVNHQTVIDIRPLLRINLVNNVIKQIQRLSDRFPFLRIPSRLLEGKTKNESIQQLFQHYGIRYLAPRDARNTGFEAKSLDCITSTYALEHISKKDIQNILLECNRLLADGGLLSFLIGYVDHYAYSDQSITFYNFLRYSDTVWKIFNPSTYYQNRLRHKDYLELIGSAGFKIVEEKIGNLFASDPEKVKKLKLDKAFGQKYTVEELAILDSHIVAQKRWERPQ